MEAMCCSESLVPNYQSTRCPNPEDHNVNFNTCSDDLLDWFHSGFLANLEFETCSYIFYLYLFLDSVFC
jgi:hypothetical protein